MNEDNEMCLFIKAPINSIIHLVLCIAKEQTECRYLLNDWMTTFPQTQFENKKKKKKKKKKNVGDEFQ